MRAYRLNSAYLLNAPVWNSHCCYWVRYLRKAVFRKPYCMLFQNYEHAILITTLTSTTNGILGVDCVGTVVVVE